MKRRGIFSIIVALLLVATLITFLIAFQVRTSEHALVLTFGSVTRTITEPGLYLKLPYPIQTVEKFDVRMRVLEGKFQEVSTVDGYTLIVNLAVGWSIDDPVAFYNLACSHALLSQLDAAFEALDRAVRLGFRPLESIDRDPHLENLRADPRFPRRRQQWHEKAQDAPDPAPRNLDSPAPPE